MLLWGGDTHCDSQHLLLAWCSGTTPSRLARPYSLWEMELIWPYIRQVPYLQYCDSSTCNEESSVSLKSKNNVTDLFSLTLSIFENHSLTTFRVSGLLLGAFVEEVRNDCN